MVLEQRNEQQGHTDAQTKKKQQTNKTREALGDSRKENSGERAAAAILERFRPISDVLRNGDFYGVLMGWPDSFNGLLYVFIALDSNWPSFVRLYRVLLGFT